MNKLTQKKFKFDWGDKQEAAFQLLKEKLYSAPILALLERAENFIIYCDDLHKGLGVVLMSKQKHQKPLVVGATEIPNGSRNNITMDFCHNSHRSQVIYVEFLEGIPKGFRYCAMYISTAYHPQTDIQSERTIQTLEDMFTMLVVIDFRNCRLPFCWAEVGDAQLIGPELIHEIKEKIVQIKYHLGKGLSVLANSGKLNPRTSGNVDREVKWLKQSGIPIIKVRWNSRRCPEFTWEREDQFRKKYPHLFIKAAPSTSAAS
ncbi:putative reverse transcriptase domain-containing protein [Tanacetum coccineum]